MRYQDWDVLVFPSGEEGAHVPVKEFRTACYVEQKHNTPTPLLTTFIPCLSANAPFQVSVHSWKKTGPVLGVSMDGTRPKEMWRVKVVIDGTCVCIETLPIDISWPQIISTTTPSGTPERDPWAHQLRFPQFNKNIMTQSHWDASERAGRIRVELSSGFVDEKLHRFAKISDVVTFAFQPAPMEVLEHCGVAWPNPRMFLNPLQTNAYFGSHAGFTNVPSAIKHKKFASANNINMSAGLSGMPVQTPLFPVNSYVYDTKLNPYVHDSNSNFDGSSRSTSAYSVMADTAAPLLQSSSWVPAYPGTHADAARQSHPITIRLPTDQLQMIVKARNPQAQQHQDMKAATSMPPPPLPSHAMTSKDIATHDQPNVPLTETEHFASSYDAPIIVDRRAESRHSDISMHAGCTLFPTCTTEDSEGHIVHNTNTNANGTPAAPATVVRGRKEGSSPTKRKLSRSAKKDDKGEKAKKRPRRSTRLLQHDSGYDGGSSGNSDDRNGDNNTGVEGTGNGTAVVEPGRSAGQEAD